MEELQPTTPSHAPATPARGERVTMRDVAARVGVSQALVSLVFRNAPGASAETRERVFRAATELGYRPDGAARLLRRTRSRHIGVLFTMQQPYDVDLVDAMYPAAERLGYHLVLGAMLPRRDERRAVEDLLDNRSEGLILVGPERDAPSLAGLIANLPVVEIGRRLRGDQVDVVRFADDRGARLAVDHLVELGHHRIVHVDGGSLPGAAQRRRGYRAAMRRHGLQDQIRVIPGDYTEESGAEAARALLAERRLPTAMFAGNDRCAHGILDTFIRAGVDIPGDVSVVGYDDSRTARLSFIDLTTIRQNPTQMADSAVQAMVERLDNGRTTPRDIVLEPQLVTRTSTGSAAQNRH
jgi:DNA-binding LacI/PurR family transcriptional regulator